MGLLSWQDLMILNEMELDEKVDECLEAIRRGRDPSAVDFSDLTDDEREEVLERVRRRLNR